MQLTKSERVQIAGSLLIFGGLLPWNYVVAFVVLGVLAIAYGVSMERGGD